MVQLPHPLNRPALGRLETEGLGIRKGRKVILDDFNWSHQPGNIALVVGENGTGKSSLLRVLAGRERPTTGSVRRTVTGGAPPSIIYYHPEMALPDHMTVGDWHSFLRRVLPESTRTPVDPALFPAAALHDRRVEQLSTGEAKRVLLTALLGRSATFIILDEPFEHLSREAKTILASHLEERARSAVVVIATNQEIPGRPGIEPFPITSKRLLVTSGVEVIS